MVQKIRHLIDSLTHPIFQAKKPREAQTLAGPDSRTSSSSVRDAAGLPNTESVLSWVLLMTVAMWR